MNGSEVKKCHSCGVELQFAERVDFRVGGTGGGWKLLFGEWAELGESMIPLNIYVCPECGRIDLFADEETKKRLLQLRDGRKTETML
jgi:predicted RNA-binding Zn-ribbon protein involved in translation (DUF1610 family)